MTLEDGAGKGVNGLMKCNVKLQGWHNRSGFAHVPTCYAAFALAACSKPAAPPPQQQEQAKRYHMTGRIVSVHPPIKFAREIDGGGIPGFMAAMTMSYSRALRAKPRWRLARVIQNHHRRSLVPAAAARTSKILSSRKRGAGSPPPPTGATPTAAGGKSAGFRLNRPGRKTRSSAFL